MGAPGLDNPLRGQHVQHGGAGAANGAAHLWRRDGGHVDPQVSFPITRRWRAPRTLQARVELQATISRTGTIENLRVVERAAFAATGRDRRRAAVALPAVSAERRAGGSGDDDQCRLQAGLAQSSSDRKAALILLLRERGCLSFRASFAKANEARGTRIFCCLARAGRGGRQWLLP